MEDINIKDLKRQNLDGYAIALGNFDGVHKGHQEIIKRVKSYAEKNKLSSAILTFEPHPISLFKPSAKHFIITSFEEKKKIIEKTNIDKLFYAEFNQEFAKISADEFISEILLKKLNAKAVFTGEDFTFGFKREGDVSKLKAASEEYKFEYFAVEKILNQNENRYSSSRIRELLNVGNIKQANEFLGRNHSISGIVKSDRSEGKKMGFATANLTFSDKRIIPKFGVYAAFVKINDGKENEAKFKAAVNIGVRPTFDLKEPKANLEAHILDFNDNIYDKGISVELVEFIREEEKFSDKDALVKQIAEDVIKIKEVLNAA